jgi:hypothetical protein
MEHSRNLQQDLTQDGYEPVEEIYFPDQEMQFDIVSEQSFMNKKKNNSTLILEFVMIIKLVKVKKMANMELFLNVNEVLRPIQSQL